MNESAMNTIRNTQNRLYGLAPYHARDRPQVYRHISPTDFGYHLTNLLREFEKGVHKMANKKSSQQSNWNKIEFVNVTLTEPQKKEFKTWAKEHHASLADELGQLMVDDYRMSCNWDDNNQCFIATFTGKIDQRINADKALSSRSDDWYEALVLNLYKHKVIFSSGEWNGETTRNNWG